MITSFLNDESDLEDRLSEFCTASQSDQTVKDTVSEILHEIRKNGDAAMLEKTLKYDHAKLSQ
ncbi:histidinol dehydrogenase, partial [Opitutales bacterium]|nr:histidinol dehydrogenase [Opitutales bacterium]